MGESVHSINSSQQLQQQHQQQQGQQQQQQPPLQPQPRLRSVTNGDVGTLRSGRLPQPQQQQPAAALATNGGGGGGGSGDSAGGDLGSSATSSPHSAAHSTHSSGLVLSAPLQQTSLTPLQPPPHSNAKTDQTGRQERKTLASSLSVWL